MRQTTRKKMYGRINVVQSLRGAVWGLKEAIEICEKPQESPLTESLKKVAKQVDSAIEAEKTYIMNRKRIASKLLKQKHDLEQLIQEVSDVPVMPEEKLMAKQKRAIKGKEVNRGKNSKV